MSPKLPPVGGKYGAPLGRADRPAAYSDFAAIPDHPHKFYLRRPRLDAGGYDPGGAYWGHGEPLWWACNEHETVIRFLRAPTRDRAKQILRDEFPRCIFWR